MGFQAGKTGGKRINKNVELKIFELERVLEV